LLKLAFVEQRSKGRVQSPLPIPLVAGESAFVEQFSVFPELLALSLSNPLVKFSVEHEIGVWRKEQTVPVLLVVQPRTFVEERAVIAELLTGTVPLVLFELSAIDGGFL